MIRLTGIGHVLLRVLNLEASKKFYSEVLGFRVLETQLERSEPSDVVQGFYSELAHTTSTGASFETGEIGRASCRERV